MLAFDGDALAQGAVLYALRILFQQDAVLHDFADEALPHFRHGAEFLRAFGQQPSIQRPAFHADPGGEHVAREVQAAHGVAQEGLLGDGRHLLGVRHPLPQREPARRAERQGAEQIANHRQQLGRPMAARQVPRVALTQQADLRQAGEPQPPARHAHAGPEPGQRQLEGRCGDIAAHNPQ
ncbi:hypothetical protein G6F68_012486 [Rhizopus microsporus]|nr:hypothetical protein G6F68_012486 [Rhizopus microsporus]